MPAPEPIPDLLRAVNAASGKAFALWITFLSVGTYLAISIGTTAHRQLLLAEPVKLPLLGVDLPLFAFYGFAPPLFAVLHLYVLMQLYLLARLLRLFDDQLQNARMSEPERRITRGQLDKFVVTQSLIGDLQDWIVRLFLRAVVWLSFVVGPVLLLFGFQLRFLPYHSLLVTTAQQVTLLLDLVLLLVLWPKITRPSTQQVQASRARLRTTFAYACSAAVVAISILAGSTWVTLRWARWLPQDLSLVNERLVETDEDKLSKMAVTLSLRGRDLRYADLAGSDFRKADLSGANLQHAQLTGAKLSDANLSNADLSNADLSNANLQDARNLTQEQLDKTCGTGAMLPLGLTLKPCPAP
jgi:uncharacterized protein YjbI with pentapeptide repeats